MPFPSFQRPRRNPIDRALQEMPMYATAPSVDTIPEEPPSELELPLNGRPRLATDLSSLDRGPDLSTGPSGADRSVLERAVGLPRPRSRLDQLESDYRRVGAPPESFKGKLAQALITMAPTALGAAFGGTYGAAGAAEGTVEGLDTKRQQENLMRKSLLEEMENERQRQERMAERQLVAQTAGSKLQEDIRQFNEQQGLRQQQFDYTRTKPIEVPAAGSLVDPTTKQPLFTAPPNRQPSFEEQVAADWLKQNPGKTLADFNEYNKKITQRDPKEAADQRYAELYRKVQKHTATPDEELEYKGLKERLTAGGVARVEANIQGQDIATGRKEVALKYNDLTGAQKLFKSMVAAKAESERAEKTRGNAGASDMALVSNHMNMTVGSIKGARTGRDIIQAHMQARSWPEEVKVAAMAVLDGRKLSPQQRDMFVRLAQERLNEYYDDYDQAKDVWSYTPRGDEKLDRSLYRKSLGEDLNQVNVIDPDGRSGRIPAEDWPAAEKQGYKKQ